MTQWRVAGLQSQCESVAGSIPVILIEVNNMHRNGSMPPLNAVVHSIGTARSVPSRKTEKKMRTNKNGLYELDPFICKTECINPECEHRNPHEHLYNCNVTCNWGGKCEQIKVTLIK